MQGNAGFRLDVDAGDGEDPALGGPCQDDGQCDDSLKCTTDRCDQTLGRCRFSPDDARCDDQVYCNGLERCDVRLGCGHGEPVACSDESTCTIDVCVEATQSCRHDPRDADGDGDPTHNCGGSDCDDDNALINSGVAEVCGNKRDDDCNGETDEQSGCVAPQYDTCKDALVVTESGFYELDLTATAHDYHTACEDLQEDEVDRFRDAVVTLEVPEGGPYDVDITARLDGAKLVLAGGPHCGEAVTASCERSVRSLGGASVARVLLRAAKTGAHTLFVEGDVEASVQLQVDYRAAEPMPGERCEDAILLTDGGPAVFVRLPGYDVDFDTGCPRFTGDAFATFTLDEPRDVTLIAESMHDVAAPVVALLDAACATERTCRYTQPGRLFARNQPSGK
jgi:hypothetical protein